jgi:acyl-[acyl-carrier-protein]-phospholipid O-acyltransferase/long-chain-fatty-acid--[acyl-carrier-protein] ligase
LMVAFSGGIYMVPLYALLQTETSTDTRSQVIAASNLFDSLFMTGTAIVCATLLALGLKITDLFLVVATLNLVVLLYARKAAKSYAGSAA